MENKENIPDDLEKIMSKDFYWIVYKSKKEKRIFVDYYYESGFFQGNIVLELNPLELEKFHLDSISFLEKQSKEISMNYKGYYNKRNISN